MASIKQLLARGSANLSHTSSSAHADAEILLCHVLQCNRTYLYSRSEALVNENKEAEYRHLIQNRSTGYPIAYITGKKSFWTLELEVNEHTLIPRPETELLVEMGLEHIKKLEKPIIIDLGTGSGAIALAMASERSDAVVFAVDFSLSALVIAKKNQFRHNLNHVHFINCNWLDAIKENELFNLIVANPPYISETDPHLISTSIQYEPQNALTSGPKGLDAASEIIFSAKTFLKPNGWLIIEHGYDQQMSINTQFLDNGYRNVKCLKDYSGLDRVSVGQK